MTDHFIYHMHDPQALIHTCFHTWHYSFNNTSHGITILPYVFILLSLALYMWPDIHAQILNIAATLAVART